MNENALYLAGLIDEDGKPLCDSAQVLDEGSVFGYAPKGTPKRDDQVIAPILKAVQGALQSGELSEAGVNHLERVLDVMFRRESDSEWDGKKR